MSLRRALPVIVTAVVTGCGASDGDAAASAASPVVGGVSAPYERAEVGRFDDCTGTLVAPQVVLSAAHCFDFRSGARDLGDFVVARPSGALAFRAVEVLVLGDTTGWDDLALVRLAEAVPEDVARPLAVADAEPAPGEGVTMWGYGCASRPDLVLPSGGGIIASGEATDKRRASFPWDTDTRNACPGDSGGPVLDARAAVVGVVSAYVGLPVEEGGGIDVFARPVRRRSELREQIARWTR